MLALVRLSTIETPTSSRVRHLIGAVSYINEDTTFETTCLGLGSKNHFGRDMSVGVYTWKWRDPQSNNGVALVTPKNDYEVFERTDNPKECALLKIINTVFGGNDYMDVLQVLGKKSFVVEEKLYIKGGRNANNDTGMTFAKTQEDNNSGINVILKYRGLHHVPTETPRYEGDCNTAIELLDDCKYEMYKLVKKVLVVSK